MINSNTNVVPSARRLAYDVLFEVFEKNAYANLSLQKVLRKYNLSHAEKGLLTEIVYGVCRHYNYLTWIIGKLSSRPVRKIHPSVRILLVTGLYQLIYLSKIPESAAVNETVKIAKKVTHFGNVRFVNAILRNYTRKKKNLAIPSKDKDYWKHMTLTYNEPEWILKLLASQYGKERMEKIAAEYNRIPVLEIRANTLRISPEDFKKKLQENHMEAEEIPFIPGGAGFRISHGADFFNSAIFRKGLAYVESGSSMVPAAVLNPSENDHVLDMCAAPGGKTINIAQMMNDRGHIDSWDLYEHKVRLITENTKKLGITSVSASVHDSTKDEPSLHEKYDKVLLDAPCSGLGVLQKKPEIRWMRDEQSMKEFPPLQAALLERAASYVKPGGVLVYSTCTLNKEENENQVAAFLKKHPEFTTDAFTLPEIGTVKTGELTLWPDIWHTDGFFIARMVKKG